MSNSIEVGQIYWTIRPSEQAEEYGHYEPCRPWQVRVTKHPYKPEFQAYHFCEAVDSDNPDENEIASLFARDEDLYSTPEGAADAYRKACAKHADDLYSQLTYFRRESLEYLCPTPSNPAPSTGQ